MTEFHRLPYQDKTRFYTELRGELKGLYETLWYTNLANVSATLMAHLPDLNWVGFYLNDPTGVLRLGPFQGLPACVLIPPGKGVCGAAAAERKSQVVHDVHSFPGHIACHATSRSELVVPMITSNQRLLGVLDLDSPRLSQFDEQDRLGLEAVVQDLIEATQWPNQF